jgi:hypothetical protein
MRIPNQMQNFYVWNKSHYNIAFVNSEHWLAKSRVDTARYQHGRFLSLYFFVLYIL